MKSILDTCVGYHLLTKERTSILEYGVRANLNIDVYIYIYTNLNHKHIFFSIAYLNMVESKKQIYND